MTYISNERLWLTADRARVVKEGDPEAAFLLVGKGGTVSDGDAKRYNLKDLEAAPPPWDAKAEHERLHAHEAKQAGVAAPDTQRGIMLGGSAPEKKAQAKAPANKAQPAPDATKAAQDLAEEEGVNLSEVEGSGKDGRITLADVEGAVKE